MKTIGVFFGSRSTEHDISIITAQLIISGLKGLGYPVVPVYISKNGDWLVDESLGKLFSFTDPSHDISKNESFQQYYIDLQQSHKKLVLKKKGIGGKTIVIDLAFPAFHGSYGEDGTIQGMFEMLDIPYVGCGVSASAIAMDKAFTKQICQTSGIPICKFLVFSKQEWIESRKKIIENIKKNLHLPLFVKPVHLGSSIGIAKIKKLNGIDLENALDVGFYYDDKVLVEEGVENIMDVTCCVIGNDKLRTSVLQESVFDADLFDFNEKYLKEGGSQLGKSKSGVVIPARLSKEMTNTIQEMAKSVYRALGCTGISRVDFLLNKKTKKLFVAEVNPLPGTLYHHLWKATGIELDELLQSLIKFAEEKDVAKHAQTLSFDSSVLTNLNSAKLKTKGRKLS